MFTSLLAKFDPHICFEHLLDLLMTILPRPSPFFNFEFLGHIGRFFYFKNSTCAGQFRNPQAIPVKIYMNTSMIAPASSWTPGFLCSLVKHSRSVAINLRERSSSASASRNLVVDSPCREIRNSRIEIRESKFETEDPDRKNESVGELRL